MIRVNRVDHKWIPMSSDTQEISDLRKMLAVTQEQAINSLNGWLLAEKELRDELTSMQQRHTEAFNKEKLKIYAIVLKTINDVKLREHKIISDEAFIAIKINLLSSLGISELELLSFNKALIDGPIPS